MKRFEEDTTIINLDLEVFYIEKIISQTKDRLVFEDEFGTVHDTDISFIRTVNSRLKEQLKIAQMKALGNIDVQALIGGKWSKDTYRLAHTFDSKEDIKSRYIIIKPQKNGTLKYQAVQDVRIKK